MPTIAKTGHGTLLKLGDGASAEQFTSIPGLTNISLPDTKLEFDDVTSHDSTGAFREVLPSFRDSDNVNCECLIDLSNTVHKSLRTANQNATKKNFQMIFPDGSQANFSAYVAGFPGNAAMGVAIRGSFTLRVTGQVVWSA